MSIGPNQISQFSYLLTKVQELNFYDTKSDLPSCIDEYTKEGPTDQGADYRSATTVGLAQWQFTPEFGQFHKDSYEPGQERVSTWVKFTNGVIVSQELLLYMMRNKRVRDDKTNMLKDVNQQFKDTWQWTKEAVGVQFQTKATSSTVTNTWRGTFRDSLVLASASHVSIKSPTVTNPNVQGAQPLSQLAIQEAITMIRNMVDDAGRPQGFVTEALVMVGPWWQWRIAEILGTDKQVDTNNNNVNALKAGKSAYKTKVDYIVNPYLSATDTSWLVIDKKYHGLTTFTALEPLFEKEKDTATGATIFKCSALFGIDALTYRGAVYGAGA